MKGSVRRTGFWVAVIAVILAGSIAAWMLLSGRTEGGTARIYQDGVLLDTIDLSVVEEGYTLTVDDPDGGYNVIQVEPGRIRVLEADCPDQICVRQGWISTSAAPVVCLPHALVIEITGGETDVDAVAR